MSVLTYQSLVEEISKIYESALAEGDANWNQSILASNWTIGHRIVEVEQDSKFRAKYGERLLNTLSQDLNRKLGSGFSARNLRYMRQFYLVYKKKSFNPRISWSHYREIVSVERKSDREKLEKIVLNQEITVRELIKIRNELFSTELLENEDPLQDENDPEEEKKLLRRPVLRLYTYRIDRNFSMNLASSTI